MCVDVEYACCYLRFCQMAWQQQRNHFLFILCESNNFHIQNQKAIFTMKVFIFSFFLYLFVCICEEFFISLKCALYTRATAADNHLTVCTARSYIESMLLIEPLSVLHSRQATCTPRAAFIYGVATHTHTLLARLLFGYYHYIDTHIAACR